MKEYIISKKKVLNLNEKGFASYLEVPYIDYREDGTVKCEGTEDFSIERYRTLVARTVYVPNGKKDKGNRNCYDMGKRIVANNIQDVRLITQFFYKTEFQLRKY